MGLKTEHYLTYGIYGTTTVGTGQVQQLKRDKKYSKIIINP